MDFLDSIADFELKEKKSRRVRSWYLYEQFKSLERNQLDAAKKLKNRSSQDKILRQELHDRRVRRKLYDQSDLSCHNSDINVQNSLCEGKSLSCSSEDFFESFCELEDDKLDGQSGNTTDTEETNSQDDSQHNHKCLREFKSLDSIRDNHSYADSVNSVIENYKSHEDFTADFQEKLAHVEKSIADEINQHLETVKENLSCLEKHTKTCNDNKLSECDSLDSVVEHELKKMTAVRNREGDVTVYNIWSKLVSFAYQVIQLNHGNCYYDYGSQFMTAVLACDVLRRGVSSMCHILQPYVSPINYTTDDSDCSTTVTHKFTNRKNTLSSKKSRNAKTQYSSHRKLPMRAHLHRRRYSEDYWRNLAKYASGYKNSKQQHSEPCRSKAKFSSHFEPSQGLSSESIWPSYSKHSPSSECNCPCHVKVANPMLKIGKYIDRLLRNIDE